MFNQAKVNKSLGYKIFRVSRVWPLSRDLHWGLRILTRDIVMQHKWFNFTSFVVSFLKQQKPQNEKSLNQNFRFLFDGLIKSDVEEKAWF